MLSQTFCYCDKQQSADSNIIQFHLTLKYTKYQSSHFCNCFFSFEMNFSTPTAVWLNFTQDPRPGNYTSNSSYRTVKNNNTAYLAFGKYWLQARGFLNYRLKYCWPKVIHCIFQPNELEREIKKKLGEKQGAKQKSGGTMAHPGPPLESRLRTGLLNRQKQCILRDLQITCYIIGRSFQS